MLSQPPAGSLKQKVAVRVVLAFAILGLGFFVPAGTFRYWEAWAYLVLLAVPMMVLLRYLYRHDPLLLERRMRMKERLPSQKNIIALAGYRSSRHFCSRASTTDSTGRMYPWRS